MKEKSTRTARRDRTKKSNHVIEAWEASEFSAVIGPFRENEQHLRFVGSAVAGLQRLESDIISDLMNLDYVEDDDVQGCVLEHLSQWTETIGIMVRILEATRDRAWELMDEADGTALETEAELDGAK